MAWQRRKRLRYVTPWFSFLFVFDEEKTKSIRVSLFAVRTPHRTPHAAATAHRRRRRGHSAGAHAATVPRALSRVADLAERRRANTRAAVVRFCGFCDSFGGVRCY